MGTKTIIFCDRCGFDGSVADIVKVEVVVTTQYTAKQPFKRDGDYCGNCRDAISATIMEVLASKIS